MALLERTDADGIAHLNLNAPEKLNALSEAMLDALQEQFDALQDDRAVRAVIISGSGKAFCAGHDLKEMTAGRQAEDGGKAYFKHLFDKCARMMTSIPKMPQPVIAQVHGIATAAGCQLVASCDLAVAGQGTQFGVNGVNIGLFCSTPMVALSPSSPRMMTELGAVCGKWRANGRAVSIPSFWTSLSCSPVCLTVVSLLGHS